MKKKLILVLAVGLTLGISLLAVPGAYANSSSSPNSTETTGNSTEPKKKCTSILPGELCDDDNKGEGITYIISLVIAILTGAVVVAGTIGIIICGVTWMTARENEAQVAMAKKRMLDIIIGLVAWVLLALVANLFIPKSTDEIEKNKRGEITKSLGSKA